MIKPPVPKQTDIAADFEIGKQLGSGHFSTVKLGHSKKDGKDYAIKIIDKRKAGNELERVMKEAEIQYNCTHPNIIKLYDIYDNPNKLYLIMELVNGGELFDRIVERGSYTERDAATLIMKICSAIKYLHDLNVVHRDLKPENLLYASPADDAEIKLTDFGLSAVVAGNDTLRTACGTPGYVAPEVLKNKGYSKAIDMWSLGVITYILLCGFPPFFEENTARLFETIMAAQYDFPSPYWDDVSADAKGLIRKLLVVDPAQRLTADQVLQDNWIRTASSLKKLDTTLDIMKKFNARRKFKLGILASISVNRMKSLTTKKHDEDDD